MGLLEVVGFLEDCGVIGEVVGLLGRLWGYWGDCGVVGEFVGWGLVRFGKWGCVVKVGDEWEVLWLVLRVVGGFVVKLGGYLIGIEVCG